MRYVVKQKDVESDEFTTISGPHDSLERAHHHFKNCMEHVGVREGLGVARFRSIRGSVYVLSAVEERKEEAIDPKKESIL
jgi:hypothetical protein